MGNNVGCDVCTGGRNQMDMRRQKVSMYDRYGRGQMMPRTQMGCDTCTNAGMQGGCDNRGNTRVAGGCDTCGNTVMQGNCDNRGNTRVAGGCDTCGNMRDRMPCDDCGNSHRDELRGMPLAMGYIPWQNFGCTYEAMEGLRAGTIFPELDKPFYGRRGMR